MVRKAVVNFSPTKAISVVNSWNNRERFIVTYADPYSLLFDIYHQGDMNDTMIDNCPILPIIHHSRNIGTLVNTIIVTALDIFPAFFTIIANVALILTFIKVRSLHTPSNVLITALCLSDFLVGVIPQPLFVTVLLKVLAGIKFAPLEFHFLVSFAIVGAISYCLVFIITADRYIAICHPYAYHRLATCKTHIVPVMFLFPASISLPFIMPHTLYILLVVIFLPISFMTMMYFTGRIYFVIRKQARDVLSIGTIGAVQRNELRRRKGEKSKAYTLAVIFGCFILCYLPSLVFLIVTGIFNVCYFSKGRFMAFAWVNLLALLNSCLNPLIYCFRMKAVRKAVKTIFKCKGREISTVLQIRTVSKG